ncbi:hypothetical protein BDQ94DRAFT_152344 [Aspergillus welwitschiae]|uniref:Uncharacterized protein n=1 Tax=Aspergillus welwitschiae TaxID=1341132 RepID=A0A3F3PN26_9EURO|nr:hypothetical protein BDQ94DRAFT_152344 [Aspergillus welwitschiae]RDH28228.1 hypothetical protein BDQ94DRAFT_152344 [Aspergillus welwitschiae]
MMHYTLKFPPLSHFPPNLFSPGVTQNLGLGNGGGIHETYLSFNPPGFLYPHPLRQGDSSHRL